MGSGTEQAALLSSEFGQAESADMDASSAMDTSEPAKVRANSDPCPTRLKSPYVQSLGPQPGALPLGFKDEKLEHFLLCANLAKGTE